MIIDTVGAALGSAASLGAVYYARSTVKESNAAARQFDDAQNDAQRYHEEAMTAERAASTEERQARYEENLRLARAFAADMALRRVAQAETIANILLELVNVASAEHWNPAPPLRGPDGSISSRTTSPAIVARLRIAASTLVGLAGPDLRDRVPRASNGQPEDSLRLWDEAMDMLVAVDLLLPAGHSSFIVQAPLFGLVKHPEPVP